MRVTAYRCFVAKIAFFVDFFPKYSPKSLILLMERVMGIEPTLAAWKAEVLPLNYTRLKLKLYPLTQTSTP